MRQQHLADMPLGRANSHRAEAGHAICQPRNISRTQAEGRDVQRLGGQRAQRAQRQRASACGQHNV